MTPTSTPTDHRTARRARTNRVRRGVVAGALTLFIGVWAGLATQLAGGHVTSSASSTTTTAVVTNTAAAATDDATVATGSTRSAPATVQTTSS